MKLLSIGEVAKQTGVSVRALRYYEDRGLVSPTRSESGQRYYNYRDVMRLGQIQLLKRVGFSLTQIGDMIRDDMVESHYLLEMKKNLLLKEKARIDHALGLIEDALTTIRPNTSTDLSTLCHHIKLGEQTMSELEDWQKVWDKYYTPEEQEAWKEAKSQFNEGDIKKYENAWPELIAKTEKLVGTDPASDAAKAVAREWAALTQSIYDVNPELMDGASRMYDNMAEWPEDGPPKPFSQEVWDFVKAASDALKADAD